MKPQYPRMLFPQGDSTQQYLLVESKEQEAEAAKDGYAIAGESAAPKSPKPPKAK